MKSPVDYASKLNGKKEPSLGYQMSQENEGTFQKPWVRLGEGLKS